MNLRSRGMKGAAADAPKRAAGTRSHGATSAPRSPKKRGNAKHEGGSGWIYGSHACIAALSNPRRTIHELLLTESASNRLTLPTGGVVPQIVEPQYIDRKLPKGTVHQGIALKAAPLEWPALEVLAEAAPDDGLILVLDQITDPHNVGAMLRLASAFGVSALVMQTRKAPPLAPGGRPSRPAHIPQSTRAGRALPRYRRRPRPRTPLRGEAPEGRRGRPRPRPRMPCRSPRAPLRQGPYKRP